MLESRRCEFCCVLAFSHCSPQSTKSNFHENKQQHEWAWLDSKFGRQLSRGKIATSQNIIVSTQHDRVNFSTTFCV